MKTVLTKGNESITVTLINIPKAKSVILVDKSSATYFIASIDVFGTSKRIIAKDIFNSFVNKYVKSKWIIKEKVL